MRRVWLLAIPGVLALTACTVPEVAQTARPDPAISAGCRAALSQTSIGRSLVNATDIELGAANAGAFLDPEAERGQDLADLASGALALKVEVCP